MIQCGCGMNNPPETRNCLRCRINLVPIKRLPAPPKPARGD